MSGENRVGIFGAVRGAGNGRLVTRTTSPAEAEPYGDVLTHPEGHAEAWQAWQAPGRAGLARLGFPAAIAIHGYRALPRGRVGFHCPDRRWTACADRRLHRPVAAAHRRTTRSRSGDAA